jgi:hypothetical protein
MIGPLVAAQAAALLSYEMIQAMLLVMFVGVVTLHSRHPIEVAAGD